MVRRILFLFGAVISLVLLGHHVLAADQPKHLITVHDRGNTIVFLTKKITLGAALQDKHIELDTHDTVEPAITQKLIADEYQVNIYRARPVVVVDGAVRLKTISPYQTPRQIARDVGIAMYDEDTATISPLTNFVRDGAGLELTIKRATPITVDFYGKTTTVRTQSQTVQQLLDEKKIVLGSADRISVLSTTPISAGMLIRITREGKQTISVDEPIPASTQIVYDADQPLGYRAVRTAGIAGVRSVTYQIEIKDGNEISRKAIASIITKNPGIQVEVIGLRNDGGGLTLSKGAQYHTDSKGVSHRETYYDLNMSVAMQACGQSGHYSVRPDGAKVDAQGFVIVAANYSLYPKCSVVETSLGPARVYDTGGFVSRYPTGFDLATDWTRADGI